MKESKVKNVLLCVCVGFLIVIAIDFAYPAENPQGEDAYGATEKMEKTQLHALKFISTVSN